jgi:hypothetical protein
VNCVGTKIITLSLILCIGLNTKHAFAQNSDSLKRAPNRSIIISSNAIYNYFTNKTLVKIYNPVGRVPNSSQIVYYWNYKYYDTYSFDVSLQYNRFISQKFALSTGIRLDQLKIVQKTYLYVDSLSNIPDLKKVTNNRYSISLPVSGNFYLKRFRFSLALYASFFTISESVYLNEHDVKDKGTAWFIYSPAYFMQASAAFKLLKQKDLYLQMGLIRDFRFRSNYGYNNFFTCGLSLEI